MPSHWSYTDDYRAKLMKLIKGKMKGKKVKFEGPADESNDTGSST